MTQTAKRYGMILLTAIAVVAIIGTALLTKDTQYENAFFYVFAVWLVVMGALEAVSRSRRNSQ